MVVAGVVSVAVAIAAFFVGVLLVLVAAIVFTIAAVAALAITVGLLIVAFSLGALIFVGPIILFVGAVVFLVSGVLALGHRRPGARGLRREQRVGDRVPLPTRPSPTSATAPRPRPHRPLASKGMVGARRVVRIVMPVRSSRPAPASTPLELEPAQPELERV